MREELLLKTGWKFSDIIEESGECYSCPEEMMTEVVIPHDWAAGRPYNQEMEFGGEQGFLDRAGIGWYRKHMELEEKKAGYLYYITFDGVYENATIWMNETLVGAHPYGYSGFKLDVTSSIKKGDNLLAVMVDNSNSHPDRWYSGAGIYRKVKLETVPLCHIEEENLWLRVNVKDGIGIVSARVPVTYEESESQDMPLSVSMELYAQGLLIGSTECVLNVCKEIELCMECPDVELWSAENPKLYEVIVTLKRREKLDEIRKNIGFRTIEWGAEYGMRVNGYSTKLKGVCLHHDAGCLGAAATRQTWYQRLKLLKDMGCNAIRTSHNIPDAMLLDLCDEVGFYVLEEFTDKWKDGSYGRFFDKSWKEDLNYMVKRDRHRPSVIMWSVGNEVDRQGSNFMVNILHMLVQEVKLLDAGRPITCALSPHYAGDNGVEWMPVSKRLDAIERIAGEVDILALNYQEQWYELIHERLPEKVILGTEIYMFFKGHEQQCMNYSMDNPWMDVERNDYVPGGFVWAGIDYLGESMRYPAKGWGGSLIKSNLVKKPVAYLWESYWSDKPMVYFCVQDYTLLDDLSREHWSCPRLVSHWNFEQYGKTVIPYMIFSNCEEVRVYINDVRYYVKCPDECESRIISGFLPYVPGCVKVVGINGGEEVCQYEIATAKTAVKLIAEPDQKVLECDSQDICSVLISAVDQDRTVCFKEHVLIYAKVEGPAVLAGVDNGDLTDTYPFQGNRVHLHWGKAVLTLRPTGEPGRIVLSVWADGLPPLENVIEVR